jgi:hypothetical protein
MPSSPPFIPPSLKHLNLSIRPPAALNLLLHGLPSMLHTSGATLESLLTFVSGSLNSAVGAALAQVLHASSSTLKLLMLEGRGCTYHPDCVRELMPGLARCCKTLEVLRCCWSFLSAFPVTIPSFPRLTELSLCGEPGVDIDIASPAWDIMASGRLPALAVLTIRNFRRLLWERVAEEGGEGGGRLARVLEAVAGTLTQLMITCWEPGGHLPTRVCHELGAAIGKLGA